MYRIQGESSEGLGARPPGKLENARREPCRGPRRPGRFGADGGIIDALAVVEGRAGGRWDDGNGGRDACAEP